MNDWLCDVKTSTFSLLHKEILTIKRGFHMLFKLSLFRLPLKALTEATQSCLH